MICQGSGGKRSCPAQSARKPPGSGSILPGAIPARLAWLESLQLEGTTMTTHVRCGTLFSACGQEARSGHTLVYDARGVLAFVGPTDQAPPVAAGEPVLDHSRQFVMPGLIDLHVHLAYGNAKSEEDIDLYSPLEVRALRGLFFAQKLLAAASTALCSPGHAGQG